MHGFSRSRVTGARLFLALALCTTAACAEPAALVDTSDGNPVTTPASRTSDTVRSETARRADLRATTVEPVTPLQATVPHATTAHASGAREVTLDVRSDAVRLVGLLEEAPADSDADRVLALQVRSSGASIDPGLASELDGARVLDARFVDEGTVTIGVDHVLRLHTGGHAVELDELVEPPLSVIGGAIAYARGYPPNLEIARTDVVTRTTVAVTHDMNPAWSPALTPDGTAIVFVSGIEGTARFYRAEHGAIRALPRTDRTPSAPVAPRFEEGLLHFVDHLGDAWLDPERGEVVRAIPINAASAPLAPSITEAR